MSIVASSVIRITDGPTKKKLVRAFLKRRNPNKRRTATFTGTLSSDSPGPETVIEFELVITCLQHHSGNSAAFDVGGFCNRIGIIPRYVMFYYDTDSYTGALDLQQ